MDHYYRPGDRVNRYLVVKVIGEGRYGIVYLVEDDMGEKYIFKQLKKEMLEQTREKLFYEQSILEQLNDPLFPKFVSKVMEEDLEGYVLEYIPGKVFEDLVFREGRRFEKKEIYEIATQLLEMIELLQQNHIVHRDIRLPNVILKENNQLGLIDFGLARYIDHKRYVKQMDYWYMADFLIHLHYTSYHPKNQEEDIPWYDELDLDEEERHFLKRLMGLEKRYRDIKQIQRDLQIIRTKKQV